MVFDDDFLIRIVVPRVSLFSFDLILRMISSRIFLVAAMLYMIWRLVISFLSMFLFVLSLRVWITFAISFIWFMISMFYS